MKNGVGVVVGRFQVDELHEGHAAILRAAAEHSKVLVVLGQHPFIATKENPLDFYTRAAMLYDFEYNVSNKMVVLPLNDCPSDELWSVRLDEIVRGVCPIDGATLYSGRDGCAARYHGKMKVAEIDVVSLKSGSQIRDEIGQLPGDSQEFRHGVIYATRNQYPLIKPAVDIAAIKKNVHDGLAYESEILLGRKTGEASYRLPGGFVDPVDVGYEQTARRELFEETGLCMEGAIEYIGSFRIEDWRRTQSCTIFSALFMVQHLMVTNAHAADDLNEVRWFLLSEAEEAAAPAHKPLVRAINERLMKS